MEKLQCEDCGWMGDQTECIKTYNQVPPDDVEPALECPKCGSQNLIPLGGVPVRA